MSSVPITSIAQTVSIVVVAGGLGWTIIKDRRLFRKDHDTERREQREDDRNDMLAMGGHVVATNEQLLSMIRTLEGKVTALETKVDTIRTERDDARIELAATKERLSQRDDQVHTLQVENESLKTQLSLTPKRFTDTAGDGRIPPTSKGTP